jgi:hypothetical protein
MLVTISFSGWMSFPRLFFLRGLKISKDVNNFREPVYIEKGWTVRHNLVDTCMELESS